MANKYDLKNWHKIKLTNAAAGATGTSIGYPALDREIPAGKTRFLTYIRVNRNFVEELHTSSTILVRVASVAHSQASIPSFAAGAKLVLQMLAPSKGKVGSKNIQTVLELKGSIDQPLVSVAGGTGDRCMGINVTGAGIGAGGEAVDVNAQFYDE